MDRIRRNKKAFTLVEMIVVIAIIGILGTIVTLSVNSVRKSGERKTAKTTLVNYWDISEQVFNQINLGYISRPTPGVFKPRLGTTNVNVVSSACTSLNEGYVFIQYNENLGSRTKRYTIKRIVIKYKDYYYYTDDGKTIYGPRSSID